jgi:peptidyl-prolyl cis-trans isomerase A (cyclophilin A)
VRSSIKLLVGQPILAADPLSSGSSRLKAGCGQYCPPYKMVCTILLAIFLCACRKPVEKVVVPDVFRVKFEASQGNFIVEVNHAWAPHAVDRFHELVRIGYYDEARFFRVLPGLIAQFGVHRDFNVHATWRKLFIVDDPPRQKNLRGTLAFAKSGSSTRSTEVFINLADNAMLDDQSFVPFGKIVEGIDVPDKLYAGYGELRPEGKNIDGNRVEEETNEYLVQRFPKMDYIKRARFVP